MTRPRRPTIAPDPESFRRAVVLWQGSKNAIHPHGWTDADFPLSMLPPAEDARAVRFSGVCSGPTPSGRGAAR